MIAGRFHNAIAQLILESAESIRKTSGVNVVALSGGVWQNSLLIKKTIPLLQKHSFETLLHQRVPPNDGGIALGQALIAAAYLKLSEEKGLENVSWNSR